MNASDTDHVGLMEKLTADAPDLSTVLDHVFEFHQPDEAGVKGISVIRAACKAAARAIIENAPCSPDRSVALRHVRDAMMNANASIVIGSARRP